MTLLMLLMWPGSLLLVMWLEQQAEDRRLDTALREARALREASQRRYITEQGAYR